MRLFLPCVIAIGGLTLFAQTDEHPNFTGTWQLDAAKSELHSKPQSQVTIQQNDDSIMINEEDRGHPNTVKCGTDGKSCKAKPEGETGEVMFYYNGPMLVETEFLGHDKDRIVKKRLKMGVDHKTMEIEVLHVTPLGPTEKWVFAKK